MKHKVEIWEVQSYFIEVDAKDPKEATDEVTRILQEHSPEGWGCSYGDRWVDVMDAEEVKPNEAGPVQ